jgi:hypothetical protein
MTSDCLDGREPAKPASGRRPLDLAALTKLLVASERG